MDVCAGLAQVGWGGRLSPQEVGGWAYPWPEGGAERGGRGKIGTPAEQGVGMEGMSVTGVSGYPRHGSPIRADAIPENGGTGEVGMPVARG